MTARPRGRPKNFVPIDHRETVRMAARAGKDADAIQEQLLDLGENISLAAIELLLREPNPTPPPTPSKPAAPTPETDPAGEAHDPEPVKNKKKRPTPRPPPLEIASAVPIDFRPIVIDLVQDGQDLDAIRAYLADCRIIVDETVLAAFVDGAKLIGAPTREALAEKYPREIVRLAENVRWFQAEAAKIWRSVPDYERFSARTYFRMQEIALEAQKILLQALKLHTGERGQKVEEALRDLEVKLGLELPDDPPPGAAGSGSVAP